MLNYTITLAPLILGLIAWGLAAAGIRKRALCCFSWCACACALWFPIYTIHRWVQIDDISAVMDCANAYMLCASVLLIGNGLLNLLAWLINRKK